MSSKAVNPVVEHLRWPGALDVLILADRAVTIAVAPAAARVGITLEQWRILARLDTEAGQTMSDIATDAGLSPSTATRLVDRLVLDGLAYRLNDSRDRRRVLVHISGQGREILGLIATEIRDRFGSAPAAEADGSPDRIGLLQRIVFQAGDPRPEPAPSAADSSGAQPPGSPGRVIPQSLLTSNLSSVVVGHRLDALPPP